MKKILAVIIAIFLAATLFAQQWVDVVYLHNGSIIRGTIIENVPDVSISIQTRDGNTFTYKYAEITKITKEQVAQTANTPTRSEVQAARKWDTSTLRIQGYGAMNSKLRVVNEAGTVFTKPMIAEIMGEDQADYLFGEFDKYYSYSSIGTFVAFPITIAGMCLSFTFLMNALADEVIIPLPKDPWLWIGLGMFVGGLAAEIGLTVGSMPHYNNANNLINHYRYSNFSYQLTPSVQPVLLANGDMTYAPGLSLRIGF